MGLNVIIAVTWKPGFSRDVSNVGPSCAGHPEMPLSKPEDLDRAKPLALRSYEAS